MKTKQLKIIEAAGFQLVLDGDDILVSAPGKLTVEQITWLRSNKPEIVRALRIRESGGSQRANDVLASNGQRLEVEVTTPSGNPIKTMARNEVHAQQIRAWNPKQELKPR